MKGTKQSVPPDNERSRTEHKPLAVSNGKVPEHNPNLIDLNSPSYDKAKKHDASEFDLLDPLSARTENKGKQSQQSVVGRSEADVSK